MFRGDFYGEPGPSGPYGRASPGSEDYGMKININNTKTMVIGRKPKKI